MHIVDLNDHSGFTRRRWRSARTAGRWPRPALRHAEPLDRHGTRRTDDRQPSRRRPSERAMTAALTPDGQRLTTAHTDGTATVWDMSQPGRPRRARHRTHRPANPRMRRRSARTATPSPHSGGRSANLGLTLTDLSDPSKRREPSAELPDRTTTRRWRSARTDARLPPARNLGVTLWDLTDRRHPARPPTCRAND